MSKRNIAIVFIVLHYVALEETIACVSSIKKSCQGESYRIILVDNNSPNGSGTQLEKIFKDDESIVVLLNDINDGYARGNNIGITYARNEFCPRFVAVLNNDIQLQGSSFLQRVNEEFLHSTFATLGPKIVLPSGITENYPFSPMSKKALKRQMVVNIVKLTLLHTRLYGVYYALRNRIKGSYHPAQKPEKLSRQENVVLHGSCIVFSELFFRHLNGFDPRTFMYKEEQLLYWHMYRKHLKSVYNPEIVVLHNEGASTNESTKNSTGKLQFLYKNQLVSSRVLLKEMD